MIERHFPPFKNTAAEIASRFVAHDDRLAIDRLNRGGKCSCSAVSVFDRVQTMPPRSFVARLSDCGLTSIALVIDRNFVGVRLSPATIRSSFKFALPFLSFRRHRQPARFFRSKCALSVFLTPTALSFTLHLS